MNCKFFTIACALLSMSFCSWANENKTDSVGYQFTVTKELKTNPVKDQSRSGTCWSFSTLSFIEDDLLRQGKPAVDLSEMFIVRNDYIEKAIKYVRMHGDIAFSAGGSAYDVLYIIDKYGIVPEEVYTGLNYGTDKHQHGELDAILKGYVDAIIANPNKKLSTAWLDGFKAVLDTYLGKVPEEVYTGLNYGTDKHQHGELDAILKGYVDAIIANPNKKLSTAWLDGFKAVLDTYLGKVPEKFTYNGVEYTPQSFAKSLGIKASDYVPLTSFTHHDFYKPFAIEVPDNWLWSEYYNIPLNELMETIDYAIDKGFTVMWASDVSEKGFQYLKGFAVVPVEKKNENLSGTELARWVKLSKSEKEGELYKFEEPEEEQYIDQKLRQEAFDNYETTDDHGMVFVGTAVDQNGTKYYKVKNSWGTEQIYGGFFYASEAFVKYKTMDILVHKDAVPVKILKKLHLK